MRNNRLVIVLTCGVALSALSACETNRLPPKQPEPPVMATSYAPPPMFPVSMFQQKPKPTRKGKVGSSFYKEACEDCTYRVNVGMGTATSGPQQVSMELPEGYGLQRIIWPNKELLGVESARVGTARSGRWAIFFRPRQDTGGARVENVAVVTDHGVLNVDVHIHSGRANNLTLKLNAPAGEAVAENISTHSVCLDNKFSWPRTQWWAPMSVCAGASPTGVYTTTINFPPNIGGGTMPVAMGWRDFGDGNGSPMALNYRVEGTSMSIDGIPNIIQLTGDGAPIRISRLGG